MPRIDSTAPLSQLLLHRLRPRSPTSPPPAFWSPIAAFTAATERVRAGTLRPEDAHHLFDELLRQATLIPQRFLNAVLAALACAPASDACRDGPALAVALFTRVRREEAGLRVAPLTVHAYSILMDCCCRARRPNLGLAIFGQLFRMGLKTNQITADTFLKCLCYAKQTDEAVNTLLHRMPEFGCVPCAISYTTILKSLCDSTRSQQALDLLKMMPQRGGCSPDLVAYNTVIHGLLKEGEVRQAYNLFDQMIQRGVAPDVVTYTSIIASLCKARAVDMAELVLRQMVDNGVQPARVTYITMLHGYSSLGRWKEARKMLGEMISRGLIQKSEIEEMKHSWRLWKQEGCKCGAFCFDCLEYLSMYLNVQRLLNSRFDAASYITP